MNYLNTKDVYDLFENGVAKLHVTDIDTLPRVNVKEIPENIIKSVEVLLGDIISTETEIDKLLDLLKNDNHRVIIMQQYVVVKRLMEKHHDDIKELYEIVVARNKSKSRSNAKAIEIIGK